MLGFVVGGDTVTGLGPGAITLQPDPDTGLTRVTAEIEHFSTYYVQLVSFRTTFTPGTVGDQPVGATFEASGRVSPPVDEGLVIRESEFDDGRQVVRISSATTADVTGWGNIRAYWIATGAVSPSSGTFLDMTRHPPDAGESVAGQSFTCTEPGDFAIRMSVSAGVATNVTVWTLISGGQVSPPLTDSWFIRASLETAVWSSSCVMPRIVATLTAPLTTYTLSPALPDVSDDGIEYAWTGADCGTTTGDTAAAYVWSHGDEDCVHFGVAHPDTTILLVVAVTVPHRESFELRCTYISAATGEGPLCEQRR